MRAVAYPIIMTVLLAVPAQGAAETTMQSAAPKAEVLRAATQLSQAAISESRRLQKANESSPAMTNDVAQTGRKPRMTASAQKPAARMRARLQESERLRIRSKYREMQRKRIALRMRDGGRTTRQADSSVGS